MAETTQAVQAKPKRGMSKSLRDSLVAYSFIAPNFIGFCIFTLVPMIFAIGLSFCNWDGVHPVEFTGISNFVALLSDKTFKAAFVNTLVYAIGTVPLTLVCSLGLAMLLNQKVKFRNFFRTVSFFPYVASLVAVAAVWNMIFSPSMGPVNQILATLGVENLPKWAAGKDTAMLTVILFSVWKNMGYYCQKFGFRSVEVSGHKFLINGAPFYFKGPCKHEDSAFRGRGYDACVTVTDLKLYEWLNANCLRMSHYPYAEEVYDLCDRLGIVVIDETPAVGIGAGPACDPYQTFPLKAYHSAVLRAMIERDKNHPCVVLWSLGNEPDTEHFPESARDYWRPLYEQAHAQDPQDRPVTMVCCQNDYTKDITTRTMDVVCINRYYGWYNLSGDLDNAAYAFKKELDFWETIDKPLILSEYGADTVAGMHGFAPEMFTEEFQVEYYRTINGCLDERRFVVGEWPWNFADFSTQQGPMRVGSCNRKGLFTRERTPKLAAHYFRDRWDKKEPNDR